MKHCVKKLLSLAFALALCLAVGGTALAETPEQEVLAYEQNVTTAADVPNTTGNLERDGYTVTIPTTVTVDSTTAKGELMVKAQLKQYRTLNIGIESKKNNWKLAYDGATSADMPKVDYTLKNENENGGESTRDTIWYYDESTHEIMYATSAIENVHTATIPLSVNVKDPSQATMSGTYSDTLTFTFNITKQSVTYTINVYEQKLQLTNSGAHVQAVNVVDASGNVTDTTSVPKETYVLEYGCADANGTPLGNAVTTDTWMRPRTGHDVSEEEDTRCWEDLSRTLTPKADFEANNKTQTINLNLVRKQYWLDVNGATDYTGGDDDIHGNQGGRIGGFVNMQVSVDGNDWTPWFWQSDGDDYWGQFPYGIHFKLGFHHVKDGYVYDTGTGTLENGFRIIANKQDTVTDSGTKERGISGFYTTYYVYQDTLTGEPTDKTSKNVRYCYIPCYKKGITYFANGGTGGTEDYNEDNPPRSNVLYEETGTLKTPDALGITAPTGKSFAGWSTKSTYTTGNPLYQPDASVGSVQWETYTSAEMSTRPKGDPQKRVLYAIWKKPYKVKVQFGRDIGWTTWDAANQSFPESNQDGDGFDTAVELGKAYAYGNTSLTLSKTENADVWTALQAKIEAKTTEIATAAQPDAVWQLKNEYTFTTLPANGEVTIQIKRKRYLLNVIPALKNDDGTYSPVSNATDAEQYGKFDLNSCGKPQTLEGKISYYQWMRNYGGSYHIYNVKANTGYLFVGFERPTDKGPTTTEGTGNLTGKNSDIHYFGDTSSNTYTGDTIYVVYEKDTRNQITFDYNGGITVTDGATKLVSSYDETIRFPKVVLSHQPNNNLTHIGWSTEKNPTSDDEIFKLASIDPVNGVNPDVTTVSSKVKTWPNENKKVLYAVWRTGPNRAPAKKALTVRYHANFDPMEELALDLDPNPLLEDMDEDFGFDPDPMPEDVLDPTVEAVKIVTYKPDENVVLRNCMFKRGGYVFVGWNTEPDGTGRNYEVNGVPITDWAAGTTVDLYAQWKKPEHLKPVVDGEPQPGGAAPAPTPQPGGADAAPAPQPGGADDAFGIDPHLGGMDDAFGVDPHLGGMDDAFGVDPQLGGMDDAFGV